MDFPIKISVIMPTYNTGISMLKEAVNSILGQTFDDFEFIIIDDGSTNGNDSYLNSISDKRVRVIRNTPNVGITKSLNTGLKQAKGKYIARMDADDISLPERLEKQYLYMEANPDVIVCGTQTEEMIENAVKQHDHSKKSVNMDEYLVRMLFVNPGPVHPSVMIRHEQLLEHNIMYDERLIYAQDYGLWEVISQYGKITVLNEVLLYHRIHEQMISVEKRDIQIKCDKTVQKKLLTKLLGNVTDTEVDMHYYYSSGCYPEAAISPKIAEWYDRLSKANKSRRIYDQKKLEKRIIALTKNLIKQSFAQDMPTSEKIRIIFRYLPFLEGIRMIGGNIKRRLLTKKVNMM